MTFERIAVLIVALSVAGAACAELSEQHTEITSPGVILSKPGPDPGTTRPIGLNGGAPSIDALLTEFLDAVERQALADADLGDRVATLYGAYVAGGTEPPDALARSTIARVATPPRRSPINTAAATIRAAICV